MPGFTLLTLLLAIVTAVTAGQTAPPTFKELREAKTAYLLNSGVDGRTLDRFTRELKAWKRFVLIDDLKSADVVITLSEKVLEPKGGAPAPIHIVLAIGVGPADASLYADEERSGVTTAAAANLVKRLRDRLEKAK